MRNRIWAPSWGGLTLVAVFFLIGLLLSSVVAMLLSAGGQGLEISMLVSYPLMFVPALLFVWLKSRKAQNVSPIDRAPSKPGLMALLVIPLTLAAGFVVEPLVELLPDMPETLKTALEAATSGNFWVNFACVCIMAPLLEEWLCRGMILRSLLYNRVPAWLSIGVSAVFFALIHGNLWQAIPAFMLGVLFGYVYYKTGSLKLTMLMHFTNNFLSLLISRIPSLEDAETWMDVIPQPWYSIIFILCAGIIVFCIRAISRVHIVDSENIGSPLQR